ncbi:MAG: right-handed parallel beta-helix repeat-containing protein, partial [Candidatus Micrarchaeia archaeon]
ASQTFTLFNTAVSSCPVITSNGTYNQVANLVGGSNSVSPPSIGGGFSTVCVKIAASNVTYNCNNFNITNDGTGNRIGVFLNSSLKNISLLNCGVNGYKVDVYVLGTNNSLFMNNSIHNASQDGIFVDSSFNSTFTGNDIFNNSQSGVDASASAGHLFTNNTLRNNTQHGIQITSSPNNTFINNTAADNANDGIHVASSDNNLFENNTLFLNKQDGIQVVTNANNTFRNNRANNNTQHGLHIVGTSNNTFLNNSMAFNSQSGFLSASSVNSSFINNTAHDNGQNGFDFAASDMDSMTNNTAYNNPQNGILLDDSNRTTHFMNHFYNNSADLRMVAIANRIINTTYDIYDRPTDAFGNFTNLSINDAAAGSTFTVTWSPQPATPPSGCPAFAALTTGSKFVNITNVSGSVTIDSIAWSWTAAESAPYNESMFRLARYNGTSWVPVANQTLDTVANNITAANLDRFGVFGILVCNDSISALKLDQTAAQPSPGGIVQFNITLTNTGNTTLNPVRVVDVLPAGLTFSAASPVQNNISGQTVTWNNVSSLAPLGSVTIFVNATVNSGVVNASVPVLNLTNVVNTSGTDPLGFNVTANSSANVTVYYANVTLVKVDITPLPPSPGGLVQWRLNVSNPGQVTLNPVALTDTLPAGFTFSAAVPVPTSVVGPVISWANIGPIAPGASVLVYVNSTVDNSTANGTYTNNANVTGKPPNGSNVTAADSASVGVFAPAVNVIKTYTGSAFQVGQNATFRIFVTNTGAINETITIVDVLPGGEAFVTANVSPTGIAGQTLTWANITVLQPGANYSINYTVFVNTSGLQTNNVTATGKPPNGNNVTDNSSASISFIPIGTPNPHNPSDNGLSVIVETDCSGNTVTVFGNGAVSGALVKVDGDPIGTTNTSGQISFPGCGKSVTVRASKSGYSDDVQNKMLIDCNKCAYECVQDTDCPGEKECVANKCTPVQCSCGVIQNHSCAPYQCCSDSQCPAGLACVGNKCVKKYECAKDSDCKDTQFCDIAKGAAGGVCRDVKGCGIVANHTIATAYQCGGPDCPQCPTGYLCESHLCVLKNITCPQTGFVGTEQICHATANNQSCSLCDLRITTPAGKTYEEKTDGKGNFPLKLDLAGIYSIGIIGSNNTTINSVYLRALEKAAPVEPAKPSILDMCPLPWWLLLLLIIIAVIVYWRSREREEKPLEKKPTAAKPPKGANPKPQA